MTHKLTLAGNVGDYFTAESLGGGKLDRADDVAGRESRASEQTLSTETIVAWVSLLIIALLSVTQSGYWALLLPSWLSLVFMVGATAPESVESVSYAQQGGSL